jgi:hypothetical protein
MSRLITLAILTCVLLYGGLLRLDSLFKTYGPYERPQWLAALQPGVRAAAAALTPDWPAPHDLDPYEGADPINYLKYAREMRNFYAAHVREPGFPAATRLGLMLTNDEDVGVSIVSIAFAVLSLAATYLLGQQIASPAVGLAAAAALAIDQTAVYWAIEGWRDEMFAFFAVLSTWAWLRLAQHATPQRAVIAGLAGGGALLTRITSISLLAPAVVFLLVRRDPKRPSVQHVAIATAIMLSAIAPFLINCTIATGDPLYAINNHTDFYLKREGVPDPPPMSAVAYTWGKFERPLYAADTMVVGMFSYPFNNKWAGLDRWYSGLGRVLSWMAVAGMVAWLWHPDGRFVLVMFMGALVPFSATWPVRGGAEWRLTLFAYSFYLVAAFSLAEKGLGRLFRATSAKKGVDPFSWPRGADPRTGTGRRPHPLHVGLVGAALVVAGVAFTFGMPYVVAREALQHGHPMVIEAGDRDRFLLADGWSRLVVTANVTGRFATSQTAAIRMPLPEVRPYNVRLRIDPLHYPGAAPQTVQVALNGKRVADLTLGWNPERVGEYSLVLPGTAVRAGSNELTFTSKHMVPIGRAGRAYPEMPRDREVGFRFWYMLVVPS